MKKIICICMSIVMLSVCFAGCSSKKDNKTSTTASETTSGQSTSAKQQTTIPEGKNPVVTIKLKSGDVITAELYPNMAPNTVKNFISLINKGFYNGLTFHRIVADFVVQGGDPQGDGSGGPGYCISGEFANNGFTQNTLKHERGILSMARTNSSNDTAGSQFFIVLKTTAYLDDNYAAFGKVSDEGMKVVDKIASKYLSGSSDVKKYTTMKTVTVDTKGITYAEPETIMQ